MKRNRTQRLIALLLALLFVGLSGFAAFADDAAPGEGGQTGETQTNNEPGTAETPADPNDPCAAGHDYGDWISVRSASCTEGEISNRYCKRTGCKNPLDTKTGDPLGHTLTAHAAKEANCTDAGNSAYWSCARCGKSFSDAQGKTEIKAGSWEIKALGHDYTDWKITKQGDCSTDGEKTRSCKRCSKTFTEPDKTSGHDYEKKVIAPTCEAEGKTVYTCKKCKKTYEEDVKAALGHNTVTENAVEPTCQKEGKTEKKFCDRCNKVFTEAKTLQKVDHKGEREAPVAATCEKEGTTGRVLCKWCGKVLEKATTTPATGHNYKTEVLTPATCTAQGLSREVCKTCGETHTTITDATGHSYVDDWIVEATCTSAGVRVRTCSVCGAQTGKENVDALGHKLEKAWTVDKQPTCTSAGSKSHHCTRCEKKYDVTTVPKTGHDYKISVKPATTKKDGSKKFLCSVCGKEVTKVVYKIASVTLKKTSYTCDNKVKTPTVVVENAAGKKLVKDTDFKATYAKGRKTPGEYQVKVTFIGDYKGSKTLKFTIQLGKTTGLTLTKSGTNKVKISYDKVKGAEKYCIYYATAKDGEYKKLANVKGQSYTTPALTRGRTYYFKVRATAKDTAGKNAFGAYSPIAKIKL